MCARARSGASGRSCSRVTSSSRRRAVADLEWRSRACRPRRRRPASSGFFTTRLPAILSAGSEDFAARSRWFLSPRGVLLNGLENQSDSRQTLTFAGRPLRDERWELSAQSEQAPAGLAQLRHQRTAARRPPMRRAPRGARQQVDLLAGGEAPTLPRPPWLGDHGTLRKDLSRWLRRYLRSATTGTLR